MTPYYTWENKKIDYFHWRELLCFESPQNPLILPENYWYGHARAIRNLGGKIWGSRIEHGVYLCSFLSDLDNLFSPELRKKYHLKRIYTYGEARAQTLRSALAERKVSGIEVIPVGPYILGADYFYSQKKRAALKKKYGRIILFFPQHSTAELTYETDLRSMIEKIRILSTDFDHVFVCLHPNDLYNGANVPYEEAGFTIVCSGRGNNSLFLSRQKDLIDLADVVATNAVGTYLGYAIAMGKPCYIVNLYGKDTLSDELPEERKKMLNELALQFETEKLREPFFKLFNVYPPVITEEQLELIRHYWGQFEYQTSNRAEIKC